MSAALREHLQRPLPESQAVDVVFDLAGSGLPADYAWPLLQALARHLPWLGDDPRAGVHPLRTTPANAGEVLLPRRAKLALRVATELAADALRLAHTQVVVGARALAIGAGRPRALAPSPTLCAQRVASETDDLGAFEAQMADALRALNVDARLIAGGRRRGGIAGREIRGYALTVHGLRAEDSLRLQCEGLGGGRNAGWGLFVPAKAIAAIGD